MSIMEAYTHVNNGGIGLLACARINMHYVPGCVQLSTIQMSSRHLISDVERC